MANAYGGKGMVFVSQPSVLHFAQQKQEQKDSPFCRASFLIANSPVILKTPSASGAKFSMKLFSRFSREKTIVKKELKVGSSVVHCRFKNHLRSVRRPHLLHSQLTGALSSPCTEPELASVVSLKSSRLSVSCSARESVSSSSADPPEPRYNLGPVNDVATRNFSAGRKTLLEFPNFTESDPDTVDHWKGDRNNLNEDLLFTSDNGLHVSQVDAEHDVYYTVVEELNLVDGPSLSSERGGVSWKNGGVNGSLQPKRRIGVLNSSARETERQKDVRCEERILLPDATEAKVGSFMNKLLSVDEKGGPVDEHSTSSDEAVEETVQTLPPRKSGVMNILAKDLEFIREGMNLVVKNLQTEGRSKIKLLPTEERYSEAHGKSTSASAMVEDGVMYANRVKDGLAKASVPILKWMEKVWKGTGVDKILRRDLEFIREGIDLVQVKVTDVLRMTVWEDALAVLETPPPWPHPVYHGLSGKDLLTADFEALKSYQTYFRGFLNTWRIPLQLSYDPKAVASYFNCRPHLLIFRLIEVSAAFSGVALQLLLDKASLWMDRSDERGSRPSTLKSAEALKHTLLRLGPTFIKVAQSLSSRPDFIGAETAKVLSELQDRLPPFPTEDAMAVIKVELGVPATQVFSYLSKDPVAAASFGQVYKGRTIKGEEVAVKVQRPGLLFSVALDIYVLRLGLQVLRKLARMNSDISVLADELGHGLFGELDYTLEASNAKEFGTVLRQLSYVKVPRTLPDLTRKRVLTMEWITGDRPLDLQLIAKGNNLNGGLASMDQRQEAKLRLDALVRKGVECSLVQLLETGVMHADPHPGNLLYTRDGILAYLDFGLLARVDKKHQAAMLAVIAHLVNGEWQCLTNDFADLDILKPSTDRFALRLALERAFGEGDDAVVREGDSAIQFGQITGKLWKIALKFRFRLPAYYTLVLRSLASLEGIAVSVDPDYKVFAAAYPYVVRRLLNDNSHSSRQVLQSLVLTQKREFRWDRIAAIMATSKKGSPDSVGQGTAHQPAVNLNGLQLTEFPSDKSVASSLLSFTLSKEGTSVRRVLLEADSKSLAVAFVSSPASSLRRKISHALAKAFYGSILTFTDMLSDWISFLGNAVNSMTSTTEVTNSELSHPEMQSYVVNTHNNLPSKRTLKNHRLWFLLKVLASRLKSSPILILRVSWTIVTMVGFAVAVALHEFAITVSDRFLSVKPANPDRNHPLQVDSVHTSA